MWNWRNKTEDHRGREEKTRQNQRGRQTVKRLLIRGNILRVAGGEGMGGWGNWVMDIKEGMCCNEHWVLCKTDESLTSTSETNTYAN